ncbi:hypothetical protein KSF_073280 [Reticulibacter mediterranei]|uniref:Uncharacterized protein n=1 Tax=Reticulibacter mediterranei TaxID=2778369 RepID=A0A8J3IRP6_9CHLR|nr:hypothetical protein KSF_073280 [Reticulibacter mediterranei]
MSLTPSSLATGFGACGNKENKVRRKSSRKQKKGREGIGLFTHKYGLAQAETLPKPDPESYFWI